MPYTIALQPGAEDDTDDIYDWYESQREGLGALFLNELSIYYSKLELNPEIFGKTGKHCRQAAMHRFPFIIIYEVRKTEVLIYAIFHTSRNPKEKFKKR